MISTTNSPKTYTPAGDSIIWQFQSNDPTILYFEVEVKDAATGGRINLLQLFPSPDQPQGVFVDLSKLLSNVVYREMNTSLSDTVAGLADPVRGYNLVVKEKLAGPTGITTGATVTTPTKYVFNAKIDPISFDAFDDDAYVIQGNNTMVKFLTNKPNGSSVNNASTEYLYFMQSGAQSLKVRFEIRANTGTLMDSAEVNVAGINTYTMFRINASPRALESLFGYAVPDGTYYTVQVLSYEVDINTNVLMQSEVRKYYKKEADCQHELVNLLWVNSLGGVDSYQFVNPQDTLNVTRVNMKKNPLGLNNGTYGNKKNGVYNVIDDTLNSKPVVTVKVKTTILTDEENYWLGEIVNSRQIFLELRNGDMVPVSLKDTSLVYNRNRYLKKQFNVATLQFTFSEGFIPALSNRTAAYTVVATFRSRAISQAFQKGGCQPNFIGSTVVYTVPEGAYTSTFSQAQADQLAQDDVDNNGQDYADLHGACNFRPEYNNQVQSQTFYSQSCITGTYPQPYVVTVVAGTFQAFSQADANQLALNWLAAHGQNEADANGTCSVGYGNEVQTQTFHSQDCPVGYAGDAYAVTVPANTYFASTQPAANQLALDWIAANGQTEANNNGGCSISYNDVSLYGLLDEVPIGQLYRAYLRFYTEATTNSNVQIYAHVNNQTTGDTYYFNPFTIYAGNTVSTQQLVPNYTQGDSVVIVIDLVTPNPDGNNNYVF